MPKEIELPDGSIAEFPDDMGDDQIAAVLSRQFKAPSGPQESSQHEPMAQEPEDMPSEPPEANLTLAERLGGMIPKGIQEWATGESEASGLTSEPKSASEAGLRSGLGAFKNEAVGALKGLGQLAVGAGETVREGGRRLGLIKDDVDGARKRRSLSERIRGTQEALGLEPEGFSQNLGAMAAKTVPAAASGGSSLLGQIGTNAALSGGQALLEGATPRGVAAATGLGAAGPLGAKVLSKGVSPLLRKGAISQYGKALYPTKTALKEDAERIIPELLKRRVSGSLQSLVQKGRDLSTEAGQAIEKTYEQATKGGKTISVKSLVDDLEKLKTPFIAEASSPMAAFRAAKNQPALAGVASEGKVAINEQAVKAISDIQEQLSNLKPDPNTLWKFRRNLDNIVRQSNGFSRELPPHVRAKLARDAREAIQRALTDKVPDVGKFNQQYRLWQSLENVARNTKTRKVGQQGLMGWLARATGGAIGSGIGAVTGGGLPGAVGGAVAGQAAAAQVSKLMTSPTWRTVSAVQKAKIADLLAKGATEELNNYLSRLVAIKAGRVTRPDVKREIEAQRIRRQLER